MDKAAQKAKADKADNMENAEGSQEEESGVDARPTWVKCTVANVFEVKLSDQTFKASIKFEAVWWPLTDKDKKTLDECYERVTERGEKLSDDWVDKDSYEGTASKLLLHIDTETVKIDGPRLTFINCIKKEVDSEWFTIAGYHPKKPLIKWNIFFVRKFEQPRPEFEQSQERCNNRPLTRPVLAARFSQTGTFQEPMELFWFPLDKQPLKVMVQAGWQLQPKDESVWLMKNREGNSIVAHSRFVQRNQYKIAEELIFHETVSDASESATELTYSKLEIQTTVYRKPGFWFWNIIVPNFIIAMTMLSSYAVEANELADRCGITVTVLLALVAFRYVISDRMPEISYSTLMVRIGTLPKRPNPFAWSRPPTPAWSFL